MDKKKKGLTSGAININVENGSMGDGGEGGRRGEKGGEDEKGSVSRTRVASVTHMTTTHQMQGKNPTKCQIGRASCRERVSSPV